MLARSQRAIFVSIAAKENTHDAQILRFASWKVMSEVAVSVLNSVVLMMAQAAALLGISLGVLLGIKNLHYSKPKEDHQANFDV